MATDPHDPLIKHYEKDPETGEYLPVRMMNEEEIKEREELRFQNTSERLRKKVLAELPKTNGHTKLDNLDPPYMMLGYDD